MANVATFTAEEIESVTAVVGTKWGPVRLSWDGGAVRLERVVLHGKFNPFGLPEVRELVTLLKGGARLGEGLQAAKQELAAVKEEQVQAIAEVAARALPANDSSPGAGAEPKTLGAACNGEEAGRTGGSAPPTGAAVDPPVKLSQVEDMSVFMRLTKMSDIVAEIRKRGAGTFEDIWAYLQQVDDAEMCPALDRIKLQGPLQERLRGYCASINVPGSL